MTAALAMQGAHRSTSTWLARLEWYPARSRFSLNLWPAALASAPSRSSCEANAGFHAHSDICL